MAHAAHHGADIGPRLNLPGAPCGNAGGHAWRTIARVVSIAPTQRERHRGARRADAGDRASLLAQREDFDAALARASTRTPDRLAGFMGARPGVHRRHLGRMLNIHPSLLPSYPGCTRIAVRWPTACIHGCTVR
jgi:phosphoribosylglycinamide formyltransferase-1